MFPQTIIKLLVSVCETKIHLPEHSFIFSFRIHASGFVLTTTKIEITSKAKEKMEDKTNKCILKAHFCSVFVSRSLSLQTFMIFNLILF